MLVVREAGLASQHLSPSMTSTPPSSLSPHILEIGRIYLTSVASCRTSGKILQSQVGSVTRRRRLLLGICCITNTLRQREKWVTELLYGRLDFECLGSFWRLIVGSWGGRGRNRTTRQVRSGAAAGTVLGNKLSPPGLFYPQALAVVRLPRRLEVRKSKRG